MSTSKPNKLVTITQVTWQQAGEALAEIRRRVFIEEQAVPEALEWDGLDEGAVHFLATDARQYPIGCARLLDGGRIGRMAVLTSWRQQGVGRALLDAAMAEGRRQGLAEMTLSAQTHAIGFYENAGFVVCSDIYDDAGIPHRDMARALSP
jgi:predicted GNAT family N-acyltransferase